MKPNAQIIADLESTAIAAASVQAVWIGGGHGGDRHVAMMAAAATKLLRACAVQVETLRRLRAQSLQPATLERQPR